MIKAKYILISFFTAGVLTFGSLPAMSQEIIGENSFGIDVSDIETDRNFVEAFNDGDEAVDDVEKDEIVSLRFVWNTPVNMASFVRNGKIWVVFDHQNKFDIDVLKAEAGAMAKEIYYLFHPDGAIIVIEPEDGVKYAVRKEGLLWILDLYKGKPPAFKVNNYTIFTQFDSLKNSYLFIPIQDAGKVMSFMDPELGDIITVSTTSVLGQGIDATYRYVDFDVLRSLQGVAFVFNNSDIVLNRGNSGITLKAIGRGLNISDDLSSLKRNKFFSASSKPSVDKVFDLQIPSSLARQSFEKVTEKYKNQIVAAKHSEKNDIRLQLAKYLIYNGLGTDALFILNQMKKLKIPESQTDTFYALSGIANFLARRYDEAISDFSQGNIPLSDEGAFWRTIAKSAKQYSEENNAIIFAHVSLMKDYPQPIKDQISIIAAENAIETGDDITSQNFIDILDSVQERLRNLDPQITYLNAKKLEMQGYVRNAVKEYKKLKDIDSAMFSAYARLRYTVLSENLKYMETKEAIAELEKLRFAWGEKEFKINVLNHLAKLYLKNNDYYNTLNVLNDQGFLVDDEQRKGVAERMVKIFEDVFVSNHADSIISPVKALALFQDFKWLAPLSKIHYKIVQKLADRLVAVDLLPRAQSLLLSLLYKQDLSQEDQAKVGARLAIIYLFEGKASDALLAIEATDFSNISDTLKSQRNIIASRALSDMGRVDEALALIKDDFSAQAIVRKFEVYWNAKDWDSASDTIKYLIEEPVPGKPLSNEQMNYILDWATTLKQAGKETVLVRLRNKFAQYFEGTAHQSAFNVLTKHLDEDKIDVGAIKTVISDIKNFNDFASFYIGKLEHEPQKENSEKQPKSIIGK